MSHRMQTLNLQWAARLHGSSDKSNLAVHLYHNCIRTIAPPSRLSLPLPLLARQNPLWSVSEVQVMPALVAGGSGLKQKKALSDEVKSQLRREAVASLDDPHDGGKIANTIELGPKDSLRPFLRSKARISRDNRWLLLQWILGAVTRHEQCRNCPEPKMTRVHASICSGADSDLATHFPTLTPQHVRHTRIDAILNTFRNCDADHPAYGKCLTAIQQIMTKCRGLRQRQSDGYWTSDITQDTNDSDSDSDHAPRPVIARPAPRTQAAIRQTLRNAETARRRNRPRGRPRRQPATDPG